MFVKGFSANYKITLANIYVPNMGQIELIQSILEKLENFKDGELLLGGDFNLILDATKDKSHFNPQKINKTKAKAGNYISSNGASKLSSLLESYN